MKRLGVFGVFVALLLSPGSINDHGWNEAAWQGLKGIEKELGAYAAQVQVTDTSRHEAAFHKFGSEKFDLVIAHGGDGKRARPLRRAEARKPLTS